MLKRNLSTMDVYHRKPNGPEVPDQSGAKRLALHATEFGFEHPTTGEQLHWTMPMPADMQTLIAVARRSGGK